ncbi:MAG: GPW/gp25 family protein [bacterium]
MEYLGLPLKLRDGYLTSVDLQESITHSIGLIISARLGLMPWYPEFGCAIWDREYADLLTTNRAEMRSSLRNAIAKFERRIYNLSVSVSPEESRLAQVLGMKVRVTGNYKDGKEEKKFEFSYDLG